jgi:hypothetical protein
VRRERCVIYGGGGFIGSHVAEELLKHNIRVCVFDKRYSAYRKVTSLVYNYALRWFFEIDYVDIDCAFKLFRRDLFDKISINTQDAFIDAEIMIKAYLLGYRSTEIGVRHLPRVDGISTAARPSVVLRTIRDIYQFRKEYKWARLSRGLTT